MANVKVLMMRCKKDFSKAGRRLIRKFSYKDSNPERIANSAEPFQVKVPLFFVDEDFWLEAIFYFNIL